MKRFRSLIFLLLFAQMGWAQSRVIKASYMLDVRSGRTVSPAVIVIEDGVIQSVNPSNLPSNAEVIDLPGKTLLPGLIDAHVHLLWDEDFPPSTMVMESTAHATLRSVKNAEKNLMAGFTTIRTIGQDHPSVELIDVEVMKAEQEGLIISPRIIPAGHAISITGGHYDLSMFDRFSYGVLELGIEHGIADGIDEVTKAVRYQIKHGAKVIKVTATAGVMSLEGSVGALQYTQKELNAIVEEASRHDVKVAAHAHGTEGIIAATKAGVASIEHGSILTEEAIQLMIENETYLVPTAYLSEPGNLDHLPPAIRKKAEEIHPKAQNSFKEAIKAGVRFAFGTDVGAPKKIGHGENAKEFGTLVRLGMTGAQAIRTATIHASELLGTDDRGVLEVGKLADIIAVNGNPLQDVGLLLTIDFVMKGGIVYKHN